MASPRGKQEANRAQALGRRIRDLRRRRGDTLKELATRIPMSPSNLSRLENGGQGPPPDETIERIADALEADPRELLRLAGRTAGGPAFEEKVLDRLDALGRQVQEVKDAVSNKLPES
jgi:transcriptional regulator with XRE-family HTH domain